MAIASSPRVYELIDHPEEHLSERQRRWLKPFGRRGRLLHRSLCNVNRWGMRGVFGVRAVGIDRLPPKGPFIIAPNHSSTLDPFAVAAALPNSLLERTYWAGRRGAVLQSQLHRFLNRWGHVIPIRRDATALATGAAILGRGRNLVWFPEGTRSSTGELQKFHKGIGLLMERCNVPAVPVFVAGSHENMPPGTFWPQRFQPISVCFGDPVTPQQFSRSGQGTLERATAMAREVEKSVKAIANQFALSQRAPSSLTTQ